MSTKNDRKNLERILRNRGRQQTPQVSANAAEVRSCIVAGRPEPLPPPHVDGLLGGCLVMWEYRVQFDRVESLQEFLRGNEERIRVELSKASEDAAYLGTYMLHAGGTPTFRTIWAYTSQEHMVDIWRDIVDKWGSLATTVARLRTYWLRDPERIEARWIAARRTPDRDYGDAFRELTIYALTLPDETQIYASRRRRSGGKKAATKKGGRSAGR